MSAPLFEVHDEHSADTDVVGDALMNSTNAWGTPEFHCKDDPCVEMLPMCSQEDDGRIVEKGDWRYGAWAGLRMVISNFNALLGVVGQLRANPEIPPAFLEDAENKSKAILAIAQMWLQEVLDSTMDRNCCSKEDLLIEMEMRRKDVERLMTKSDAMKAELIGAISGGGTSCSSGRAGSDTASPRTVGPSASDISATQRLTSPRSGKPQQSVKKPPKRSGAPALSRNHEGRHVRR